MINKFQSSQTLINHLLALPLNINKKDLEFIVQCLFLAKQKTDNPTDEALFIIGAILGTGKNFHVLEFLKKGYEQMGLTSKDWLKFTHYAGKLTETHNNFIEGKRSSIDVEMEIVLETYAQMYEEFKKL